MLERNLQRGQPESKDRETREIRKTGKWGWDSGLGLRVGSQGFSEEVARREGK